MASVFRTYPRTFWVANTLELFERLAYYGFFMLFANYLTGSSETGALEFTQAQKGWIMGVGTAILYFLPVVTGAIADRYGYRRILTISFVIYGTAFLLLPLFNTFAGVFAMYIYLAIGAALFKPVISATISKTTDEHTASIGFGIFYMMVNIGAFLGPLITLLMRKEGTYQQVFYVSAAFILLNFILLLFYREPETSRSSLGFGQAMKQVFGHIWEVLLDYRFVIFLMIVAGFWIMYLQLFFTLPVFISQWVDTTGMQQFFSEHLPFVAEHYSNGKEMDAEFVTNFDALYIILFQLVVSSVVMRFRALPAMVGGIIIASVGMALTLMTQQVLFIMVAMFIFSVGEMTASPKITEYIGRIAPPEKKALYMGYSFIPVFLGNLGAGWVSGSLYQQLSDKHQLVLRTLEQKGIPIDSQWTKQECLQQAAQSMHMDNHTFTRYLWDTYHPNTIWITIFSIGIAAALLLFLYNNWINRSAKSNPAG